MDGDIRMAKTGTFEYKCRRCGKIDCDATSSYGLCRMILINLSISEEFEIPNVMGTHPKRLSVCHCEDGGMGLSDLIGFKEDKQ